MQYRQPCRLRLPNANFLVKNEPFIQKGVLKRSSRLFEEMSSSSSSSLLSGSNTVSVELHLIPCKLCNGVVIERVSKQPESTSRKFYRCRAKKMVISQFLLN
ncbi:hypothetical protein ZEAMMB73_Zm00001d052878 [Zea mays]|uniref:Zinc finger GRF-type domain-containing protein n=1 Tax=Zea mays TaxID=4577 RepID=A0A1D6QKM4_MAIZE|nr:hypothetical protein ZEAMMB73_Zm00001d052878 [Zea mays]